MLFNKIQIPFKHTLLKAFIYSIHLVDPLSYLDFKADYNVVIIRCCVIIFTE